MRIVSKRSGASVLMGIGVGLLVFSAFKGGAQAQDSTDLITLQARVLQNGVPSNADLDLTFEVYDDPTTGMLLWSETQQAVPVRNGILSVKLGAVTDLGDVFKGGYSNDRYVAVKLDGSEIVPRIKLTAVPYAHRASSATVSSMSIMLSDGGSGGLSITDLDVKYVENAGEIAGYGLEDDGSGGDGALRIASSGLGAGLTGGSGSPLAVNPAGLINGGGGAAVLNGDRLEIDFSPSNYTRTTGGVASDVKDLAAHLIGIDAALGASGSRQEFDSSGTWYKPASGNVAFIECWGGGGGGGGVGGYYNNRAGGGGGGAYSFRLMALADLASSETVTIGLGGAGGLYGEGGAGGNTTFGSRVTAYGGGGGGQGASGTGGGGGGGALAAGGTGSASAGGSGGGPGGGTSADGFGGGSGGASGTGSSAAYGGGGGGGAGGTNPGNGGNCLYGGAGGGGTNSNGNGTGGTSVYGGAGGAGTTVNGTGNAGSQPGGGGGGARTGTGSATGGSGGAGRCVVTVW